MLHIILDLQVSKGSTNIFFSCLAVGHVRNEVAHWSDVSDIVITVGYVYSLREANPTSLSYQATILAVVSLSMTDASASTMDDWSAER